jgi:polysaccharide export outer membrane protein
MRASLFPSEPVMNLFQRFLACCLLILALPSWAVAEPSRDYVLGPGDVVRISVFQSPELSLDTRVSETGFISYPLLGSLKLGGQSAAQAEALIAKGLRDGGFVREPQVSLLLMQVKGNQVSVLGQVNRPGRYPIEVAGMRLSDALAQAGGIAVGGSDIVTLTGTREGKPYLLDIDLPRLLGGKRGEDPVLRDGDVLFVDRVSTIYIYGEVQRPGQIRLERDMSVMQALAAGGGLNLRGTDKGLRLHRRTADGSTQVLSPQMTDRLSDGDVLFVRESLF